MEMPPPQWDVLPHGDLVFAGGAEAAPGIVHRNAQRQAVDDHIEEGADARPHVEGQKVHQGVENLKAHEKWRSLQTWPAVREYGSKN